MLVIETPEQLPVLSVCIIIGLKCVALQHSGKKEEMIGVQTGYSEGLYSELAT